MSASREKKARKDGGVPQANPQQAAAKAKTVESVGALTLKHVDAFEKELADAGVHSDKVSPKLLPNYARGRECI